MFYRLRFSLKIHSQNCQSSIAKELFVYLKSLEIRLHFKADGKHKNKYFFSEN